MRAPPRQRDRRSRLRRNLTYRHSDATADEVNAVIDRCGLREFVDALPDGLDHRIDEGGINLSSGQRQRVAPARALLGNPRLLILGEADANLDATTASLINDIVEAHSGTCIIVTHRAERLAVADHIWHLDAGRLIENGPTLDMMGTDTPTAWLFSATSSAPGAAA